MSTRSPPFPRNQENFGPGDTSPVSSEMFSARTGQGRLMIPVKGVWANTLERTPSVRDFPFAFVLTGQMALPPFLNLFFFFFLLGPQTINKTKQNKQKPKNPQDLHFLVPWRHTLAPLGEHISNIGQSHVQTKFDLFLGSLTENSAYTSYE